MAGAGDRDPRNAGERHTRPAPSTEAHGDLTRHRPTAPPGGPDLGAPRRRPLRSARPYPQSSFERMNARRIARGQILMDPTRVYDARGVPDEQIHVTVDLSEAWQITRDAMCAHRSQRNPPWSDHHDDDWRESAGAAHLVQAWPPRERSGQRMTDVFQGLGSPAPHRTENVRGSRHANLSTAQATHLASRTDHGHSAAPRSPMPRPPDGS